MKKQIYYTNEALVSKQKADSLRSSQIEDHEGRIDVPVDYIVVDELSPQYPYRKTFGR